MAQRSIRRVLRAGPRTRQSVDLVGLSARVGRRIRGRGSRGLRAARSRQEFRRRPRPRARRSIDKPEQSGTGGCGVAFRHGAGRSDRSAVKLGSVDTRTSSVPQHSGRQLQVAAQSTVGPAALRHQQPGLTAPARDRSTSADGHGVSDRFGDLRRVGRNPVRQFFATRVRSPTRLPRTRSRTEAGPACSSGLGPGRRQEQGPVTYGPASRCPPGVPRSPNTAAMPRAVGLAHHPGDAAVRLARRDG